MSCGSLNLSDTVVTDAGLAHLQGLPNLMTLHLENTRITDTGLRQLGKMHHLELLALGKTAITDAGLPATAQPDALRALGIHDTGITAMGRGCRALRVTFPGCISTDISVHEPRVPGAKSYSIWYMAAIDGMINPHGTP